MLDTGAHLSALTADSEALIDLAAGHLDAPVAACPDWDVAQLVGHLGGVYSLAALIARAAGERPGLSREQPPEDRAQLDAWFRAQRAGVLEALTRAEPDDPAWIFVPPGRASIGWWRRRQAMETAIHLFDVEDAAGSPGSIEPELAADGADEALTVILPAYLARKPVPGLKGSFHVHATDADGEWSLDFGAEGLAVRRDHAKADTAVRGPAAGLFLWLWNRRTPEQAGLEVFGDTSVVDAWSEVRL
jgi:uncharacterized protein (TIGR03083 family)